MTRQITTRDNASEADDYAAVPKPVDRHVTGVSINFRCRHYLGTKPCVFNKVDGSECPTCRHASEFRDRILFIKLDAIGDVLRSASLLPILEGRHPGAYVAWLTKRESVALVRMINGVDEVIELDEAGLARLATGDWDHVYSLSNDLASASLASMAASKCAPVGFHAVGGVVRPTNEAAAHWLGMAAFDRLKRRNTQSYQRLMADILGADGPLRPPAITVPAGLRHDAAERVRAAFGTGRAGPRIAINLGSGARWPKKMIDAAQIARCSLLLRRSLDADVMLVGGTAEAEKLREVIGLCDADPRIQPLLTTSSIPEFVALLTQADVLLCGDTLALHIATAIGLPTVAVFGPTSEAEIADFDGLVAKTWTPRLDCLCCYGDCAKAEHCMSLLDPADLVDLVVAQLRRAGAQALIA